MTLTVVVGSSGSGKTTFLNDVVRERYHHHHHHHDHDQRRRKKSAGLVLLYLHPSIPYDPSVHNCLYDT
jgi:excinuclease UvrABC ATPase subunit